MSGIFHNSEKDPIWKHLHDPNSGYDVHTHPLWHDIHTTVLSPEQRLPPTPGHIHFMHAFVVENTRWISPCTLQSNGNVLGDGCYVEMPSAAHNNYGRKEIYMLSVKMVSYGVFGNRRFVYCLKDDLGSEKWFVDITLHDDGVALWTWNHSTQSKHTKQYIKIAEESKNPNNQLQVLHQNITKLYRYWKYDREKISMGVPQNSYCINMPREVL